MRIVTKKVYYCDFCGKHGLRPLTVHESRCTANPDRECHWKWADPYGFSSEKSHIKAGALRPLIRWCKNLKRWNAGNLAKLREKCDGCPACMLAVLRQARPKTFHWDDGGDHIFDFEKEKARFNEELRQDEQDAEYQSLMAGMY